jgi:hypothetical protein
MYVVDYFLDNGLWVNFWPLMIGPETQGEVGGEGYGGMEGLLSLGNRWQNQKNKNK